MSTLSQSFRRSLKRAANPAVFAKFLRLQRNRRTLARDRVEHDPQLELYSRMLARDFLHYGYFADPDTAPETVSVRDLEEAQLEYARLFLKRLDPSHRLAPVLDIGCGLGGLSALLAEEGYRPVALSPDKYQIHHIEKKYPGLPTLHCKFEDLAHAEHQARYGTVITSESLQYLKLDRALPLLEQILLPGGKWLICDYFRRQEHAHEKSGHLFEPFLRQVRERGWIVHENTDITPNIMVTLKYAAFLADRMIVPLVDFGIGKLKVKQPGWAYLFGDLFQATQSQLHQGLETVNPERFAREKTYRFLELRRPE